MMRISCENETNTEASPSCMKDHKELKLLTNGQNRFHENGPRKVYIYIYFKSFHAMNVKEQSFRLYYHMYLQWHPTEEEYEEYLKNPDDFTPKFKPKLKPSNSLEIISEEEEYPHGCSNPIHLITPQSAKDIWEQPIKLLDCVLFGVSTLYQVQITTHFNMRNFPFDVQNLHVFYESTTSIDHLILLPTIIRDTCVNMELNTLPSAPDYSFNKPVIEFNAFAEPPDPMFACCTVTFKLQRKFAAILLRIFFPITIVSACNMAVLLVPKDEIANRLSLSLTLMLSMVAFQYVVADSLPTVPYLTLGDWYIFSSFTYLSLIVIISMLESSGILNAEHYIILWTCGAIWISYTIVFCSISFKCWMGRFEYLDWSYSQLIEAMPEDEENVYLEIPQSDALILYPTKESFHL